MKKTTLILSALLISPLLLNAQADSTRKVQSEAEINSEVTLGDAEAATINAKTSDAAEKARQRVRDVILKVDRESNGNAKGKGKGKGKGNSNGNSKGKGNGNSKGKSKEDREKEARQEANKEARMKEREAEKKAAERKAAAEAAAKAKNEPAPAPAPEKKMTPPAGAAVETNTETKSEATVNTPDAPAKPEMKISETPGDAPAKPAQPAKPATKPEMKTAEPAPAPTQNPPAEPAQPAAVQPDPAAQRAMAEAAAKDKKRRASGRNKEAAAREKRQEERAAAARAEAKAEAAAAAQSNDPEKSRDVVARILGVAGVAAGLNATVKANRNQQEIRRIKAESIGRTERDREQSVDYLVRRFRGEEVQDVPQEYQSPYYNQRDQRGVPPHYRDRRRDNFDGYRHVRYQNRSEIPAILLASSTLNRVDIQPVQERYRGNPQPVSRFPRPEAIPEAYQAPTALDLSYKVDKDSEITQDDILFLQGSTAFADDYSNDIVLDLAYAMQDPSLANMNFVVEGHASAEGSYELNLDLSQRRAERIVREMVAAGVSPHRLVPVGYGESEAYYAENAPESQRRFDRKVVVFCLAQ